MRFARKSSLAIHAEEGRTRRAEPWFVVISERYLNPVTAVSGVFHSISKLCQGHFRHLQAKLHFTVLLGVQMVQHASRTGGKRSRRTLHSLPRFDNKPLIRSLLTLSYHIISLPEAYKSPLFTLYMPILSSWIHFFSPSTRRRSKQIERRTLLKQPEQSPW